MPLGIGGVFEPPTQLPQDLPRAGSVAPASLAPIELCLYGSDFVMCLTGPVRRFPETASQLPFAGSTRRAPEPKQRELRLHIAVQPGARFHHRRAALSGAGFRTRRVWNGANPVEAPLAAWRAALIQEARREYDASRTGRLASQSSSGVTGSTKSSSSQSGNNATLNRRVPFGQTICNRLIKAPAARLPSSSTRRGNSATWAALLSGSGRPCSCRTSAIGKTCGSGGKPISKHAAAGSRMRKTNRSSPERNRATEPATEIGSALVCTAHTILPDNFGANLVLDDAPAGRSVPLHAKSSPPVFHKPPTNRKLPICSPRRRNCRRSARVRRVFGCCHR